ncbi:FRAS1-related extracellular matrix protein 2-like [Panulirus ornatus]|uniref:FRAS1-related extracellular matrix protein 2-like n=1 Tax=Panulirus ornatus TaxID=150431 RepID=UPI003A86A21A
MDSFEFVVTDGYNSVFRTFRISISDVDNRKPVLFLGELRVREGGSRTITPFEMKVEDRDTPPELLRFAVTRPPLHGSILYNGTRATRRFTQSDLEADLIAYHHDASETLSDDVRLVVTDGTHADFYVYPDVDRPTRKPQRLLIRVEPVDNGVPKVRVNKGASHVAPLGEDGGGPLGFVLSSRVLLVQDRDTGPDAVTYRVEVAPLHGSLVSDRHPNASIRAFTQEDVNERRIAYHLQEGVNVTSDSFGFSVVDTGENQLEPQVFKLAWSWVSLEKEVYEVNETSEMLIVTLRRRGYLGETSFVTMDLQNKTAHTDLDLHYSYARQVQFNPGQKSAQWRLRLVDDVLYEGRETLSLTLRHPVMTALETPLHAVITIHDEEDVSRVEFAEVEYKVEEDIGELPITLVRHGDVSQELAVKCATHSGSATGTVPATVLSYSDYISHPNDPKSMVRFGKGERESVCRVIIIDDSLHEDEESFIVVLSHPLGGALGHKSNITITILPDLNDVPVIFFGESVYHVDESIGSVEITVWRSGTDLSRMATAQLASKALSPQQAQAGYDYVALGRQVDFLAGVTVQRVQLTILDDLGLPALEGTEILKLVLQVPFNASLGDPAVATIIINDSLSDLPRFEFHEAEYSGYEGDGDVTAWVKRSGDLAHAASVRCYTRQDTAVVTEDFDERPNTNSSFIYFQPGETERPCTVILVDDHRHEEEEVLHLVLGTPVSTSAGGALLGVRNTTTVLIKDKADKSTVRLEESRVSVKEPQSAEAQQVVRLGVLRTGDTSTTVAVRLHTKDGSATAGKDYFAISKEVVFLANDSRVDVEVTVLGDAEKEHRESFTVHLKPLRGSSSKINIITSKVIVYIEEMNTVADVTFPAPPAVVSLRDYDLAFSAPTPIPGYPLICITACNMKYPDFTKTGPICIKQRINDTLSTFRWKVAAPSGFDGVTKDLRDVSSDTFFSSTHGITLDSVYFSTGSQVQCLARAYSIDEDAGLELASKPVTVGKEGGLCAPRYEGTFGADPFTARLHYTGPKDPSHPSLVRVEVVIPHRDGMIPIISTRPLTNFELTLSRDSIRIGNHRCSNLLDFHEVRTRHGFLTNDTQRMDMIGEMEPYQYSALLRSQPTLRFYRALDVESCLWRWVGYYTMSELVTQCGGDITTDGQVLDAVLSYVSVAVPLYVSYIFHSPVATGGWQHTDLTTHLRLSFVYDTAILWHQGIGAPVTTDFNGFLYPTAMKIKDDGCLIVRFRTEARFRGIYLEEHQASEHHSSVSSDDHPDLSFTLSLLRSQPTYSQPEQYWQFVSDFAVQDYSGSYVIHLLPCTVNEDVAYSFPLICNPQDLIMFDLKVRFQQVSDPVPEQFSLNTLFHLMRQRDLWLSELTTDFDTESDVSFYPGDRIYGRIMIDPVQSLGEGFHVNIEKCFICTGVDGYIPKYNPDTDEYGCVADSQNLLHNFKIIDKGAPDSVHLEYHNVGFDARLAADDPDPDIIALINQPAADGFSLDSSPLFQVSYGRQWFIHCIYIVRSEENAARGIGKRDTSMQVGHQHYAFGRLPNTLPGQKTASPHNLYQRLSYSEKSSRAFVGYDSSRFMQSTKERKKRANDEVPPVDVDNGIGTNMHRLSLKLQYRKNLMSSLPNQDSEFPLVALGIGLACTVVLLTSVAVVVIIRNHHERVIPPGYMTVSVTNNSDKNHLNINNQYYHSYEENTEV